MLAPLQEHSIHLSLAQDWWLQAYPLLRHALNLFWYLSALADGHLVQQ